ncbi:MAG: hypothetical protein AAFV53_28905 [Myxococcota bacterium]
MSILNAIHDDLSLQVDFTRKGVVVLRVKVSPLDPETSIRHAVLFRLLREKAATARNAKDQAYAPLAGELAAADAEASRPDNSESVEDIDRQYYAQIKPIVMNVVNGICDLRDNTWRACQLVEEKNQESETSDMVKLWIGALPMQYMARIVSASMSHIEGDAEDIGPFRRLSAELSAS